MLRLAFAGLILGIVVFSQTLNADESIEPRDYFYVIPSAANRHYLVSSLLSWSGEEDQGMSRLQVFESASGKLKWEVKGLWARSDEVFLSDDGEHLMTLRYWQIGKPGTVDLKVPVLSFYHRGKLLKKWSSEDLKIPRSAFRASTSHSGFWPSDRPAALRWDFRPGDPTYNNYLRTAQNPFLEGTTFSLRTHGGEILKFDIGTGELSSRSQLPPPAGPPDPFESK
ncbi:hypothetical protein KBB96_06115 [Luteolibacter ambystomatis]|uniref:Uncharacterized protein n=1 Tax=Luteolibacter ambystomatis TaxID=2824561 RepID=A0A975PGC8_9BACT|nr:hypothetical protein [Luteolibacter ambystomatis]QUE52465.1 hypothetical protein KBB96_06115 [Luteolibacter ambystomatis]